MRIKKLEIIGFKSFKDRTVIQFDSGITGIVGPNGCGKSNIVDALQWVMGEMSAKSLRGSSMEDVIFAGSETYSSVGMAEVSLVLENDGGPFPTQYSKYSEIMITRRLHRSGESDYLINKEQARLRDIQDIFLDTGAGSKGFSTIEQGQIGKIITQKPEERRVLIEEAAGISKFKIRKKESQRKLVSTEQNLVRLRDIIGELKRQLESLNRQAVRAERYRRLKKEVEDIELSVSSKEYVQLRQSARQARADLDEAEALDVQVKNNIEQLDARLQDYKTLLLELDSEANSKKEIRNDHQIHVQKLEFDLHSLKIEIDQAFRNKERADSMLSENKTRYEMLQNDRQSLQARLQLAESEFNEVKVDFEVKNDAYQSSQSRIDEIDEILTTKRRELLATSQSESHVDAKVMALESQIADNSERFENATSILTELKNKFEQFELNKSQIEQELQDQLQLQKDLKSQTSVLNRKRAELSEASDQKKKEVEEFKDRLNEVTSRLYGLENLHTNFEGFQEGVKNVMLWQRQKVEQSQSHIEGGSYLASSSDNLQFKPIAEVVEVPKEYEMAMELALGNRLQMLLSKDNEASIEALDFLRESNKGRSSFLKLPEEERVCIQSVPDEHQEGVVALLKNVVCAPESYQSAVSYLLDGVVIVDNIRTALRLRENHSGCLFVTTEGDTLTPEGIISGGSNEDVESGVLKRRREIKELSLRKEEWAGKLSLAQESQKKIEVELLEVINQWQNLSEKLSEQDLKVAEDNKDLERAESELRNATVAVERQEKEVSSLQAQVVEQTHRCDLLKEELASSKSKKESLEVQAEDLRQEYDSARMGIGGLQEAVTQLKVKKATLEQEISGIQRQLDMVNNSINEIQGQVSKISAEAEKSLDERSVNQIKLDERKAELESRIREHEDISKQVSELVDQYEVQSCETRDLEERLSALYKQNNSLQTKMNDSKLKLDQVTLKENNLIEQINEKYMILLPEVADRLAEKDYDPEEAQNQLKDLKEKLSRIGEVNLSAIEECEETAKRYEFLSQQHDDLIQSKDQLKKVIDRINRICSRRFRETFELVNEKFKSVFPVLFGGGEAQLILKEDLEKQDFGIEIIARPPGKKMQNISLMSGGEKALTSVALIFSIFLVKPSPYCLLDEVDAPLDDANVYRFNDLVKEMAKKSQIICVTHNKHTMEIVGRLYGVTMEEKGISKMVSVNLEDAQKVLEG